MPSDNQQAAFNPVVGAATRRPRRNTNNGVMNLLNYNSRKRIAGELVLVP